jgi:uncharacterized protein
MTESNSFFQSMPKHNPVSIYGSVQFDMFSKISGRTYRIFIFKPAIPPPPSGYPVVLTTDGNLTFPIMATLSATFALTGKAALVIGVGYPTDDPMRLFSLRYRDQTPSLPLTGLKQRPGQQHINPDDYGGSENFFRFLTEELRPLIAVSYPVDPGDQTLYGHSIAGMFTLHVLFNHPESFTNFVASSPSIWWNKRSVLNDVPGLLRKVQNREIAPRLLLLVGDKEQDVPATLPPEMTSALMKKMHVVPSAIRNIIAGIYIKKKMLDYRMVDNARGLSDRLQQIKGGKGYVVGFHAFEGEDHLTVLPASISRALAFVLKH